MFEWSRGAWGGQADAGLPLADARGWVEEAFAAPWLGSASAAGPGGLVGGQTTAAAVGAGAAGAGFGAAAVVDGVDMSWSDARTAGPRASTGRAFTVSAAASVHPVAPSLTGRGLALVGGEAVSDDAAAAVRDVALETALAGAVPGPGLAALLGDLKVADVADHVLVEVVAAGSRLAAWAAGVQASAAGELAARRAWSAEREHLGDELAATVGHTPTVGRTLVARGEALEDLPEVRSALTAGVVDVAKVDVLAFTGVFADPVDRRAATMKVLPDAPRLGLRALRTRMLAEAVKASPEAVEINRKAAAAERYVRLEAVENSMAYLTAYLPAGDAAAVWAVLDDAGHQVSRTPGEARTLAQARADALVALTTGRILPTAGDGETLTTTAAPASQSTGSVCATTSTTTSIVVVGAPTGGTVGGTAATTSTSVATGPAESAPAEAAGTVVGGVSRGLLVRPAAGGCASCGASVGEAGYVLRPVPVRPLVRVTVGAGTLLGLDDAPGELSGYGPVPAQVARTLAEDATWQRLVTDPLTGILTDHSTKTYVPGRVLRRAVEARDGTCTFPFCDRPAERCDLDHIHPFDHTRARDPETHGDEPGQTRAANLHPLCRRHHRAKTTGGWTVTRDETTGTIAWTSPTGRTFTRTANTVDPSHDNPATQDDRADVRRRRLHDR
ncbi:HNH endonuclease [Antribacter sp. KLBMP9083]|uniref:HNH endonuclease n=1 Tax=Antribacter soli TaxID=2910976 RepID=A0AA41QI75_9MICO|nr:HNH endonuclease signature motif containing protein [Antribacter soli]MCF4123215.1 HNH endonuclease [Antribacter soli]